MSTINFILGPFLGWLPVVFSWALFLSVVYLYFFKNRFVNFGLLSFLNYKLLIKSAIFFRIFYALALTVGQYYIWSQNAFTKILLSSALGDSFLNYFNLGHSWWADNKYSYFVIYVLGRFWLNVAVSLVTAAAFYVLLRTLKQHNERFFEEGEVELGFLSALIIGWPNFILFIPLVFSLVVVLSVFRQIFYKNAYTTLGLPFFISVFMLLVWGQKLIDIFGFGLMRI